MDDVKVIKSINYQEFFLYPEEALDQLESLLIGMKIDRHSIKETIENVLENCEPFGFDSESLTRRNIRMSETVTSSLLDRKLDKNQKDRFKSSLKFNSIRLLESSFNPASWNMALDEVLLMNYTNDKHPILRLYGWSPPAVSIGYFQDMDEEVNVDKCNDLGIEVVRRMTGGGAVLHQSELTYSFITKTYPMNILAWYKVHAMQ